jgi:heterodisulfide reductase subunit C
MLNDVITMIPVYIMGHKYDVPLGLTILKAMEFAGYRLKRGCGCRGGVCGACVTIYRRKGDYKLKTGLACQTQVEPEMYLTQLPYVPANRALFSIKSVSARDSDVTVLYPEIMRCLQCGTCSKACPMGLEVMDYVAAVMRGDLELAVELSMECLMCGMCAARCPAELSPFNIAMLVRRIYGRYVLPRSPALANRLNEISEGKFREELEKLKRTDQTTLSQMFQDLQAEKGASV